MPERPSPSPLAVNHRVASPPRRRDEISIATWDVVARGSGRVHQRTSPTLPAPASAPRMLDARPCGEVLTTRHAASHTARGRRATVRAQDSSPLSPVAAGAPRVSSLASRLAAAGPEHNSGSVRDIHPSTSMGLVSFILPTLNEEAIDQ